jgi:hypothetical protein
MGKIRFAVMPLLNRMPARGGILAALTWVLCACHPAVGMAQVPRPTVSKVYRVAPHPSLSLPAAEEQPPAVAWQHACATHQQGVTKAFPSALADDPDASVVDGAPDAQPYSKTAQFTIGRGFTVNNLTGGTPGDNSMAISNGGFIVSADNATVDYYKDTPDTLLQFQFHRDFFADSSITRTFDPRVIYDRYTNRFIVLAVENAELADNFLRVSFSKGEDPRDGWNHYRINTDTLDVGQWFDHPNLAINRDELFISGVMVNDQTLFPSSNKIFQIKKQDGYDSLALRCQVWADVVQADGDTAVFLLPFSDGLMSEAYSRGMYFTNTSALDPGQTNNRIYWYRILDSIGGVDSLEAHVTSARVPYDLPRDAFQMGTQEAIFLSNNRIQSGYYLNGKLFFVYCKNTSGYCTVVLNILDLDSNQIDRHPWGFASGFVDDCFPSIAPLGVDSLDDRKIALTFQRTGTSIYPQLRCVFFDTAFSANSILVKAGLGPISFAFANPERWGDYTTSQRRYGPLPAVWAVGSYPVGAAGNWFGNPGGLNGFMVEYLGDSATSVSPAAITHADVLFFPNPAAAEVNIQMLDPSLVVAEITLMDILGRSIAVPNYTYIGNLITMDLQSLPPGTYFARILTHTHRYVHFKFVHY